MFSWLLILILLPSIHTFLIDNEVVGEPKVDCEDTMLALTFKTRKPFSGRVYVQGLSDDDRCARSFTQNTNQSRFSLMVQNGDCTMQRHRVSGKLEGLMFSLTIVVSFHGTFVTRADRAYRCMCFFRSTRRLTNSIEIASLGTTELVDTAPMPSCSYAIRMGSPDGPPVVYGQVGDKIYHLWECEDQTQGMLVHSCFVTDGRGFKFDLLDVDGCAIDPLIQSDVQYDRELSRAFTETWGYKFSDTAVLNYECVIELCKKDNGECDGLTPPMCGRSKRSIDSASYPTRPAKDMAPRFMHSWPARDHQTVEVLASINMIDGLREKSVGSNLEMLENSTMQMDVPWTMHSNRSFLDQKMCISYLLLGVVAAGLLAFLLTGMLITCSFVRRRIYKVDT